MLINPATIKKKGGKMCEVKYFPKLKITRPPIVTASASALESIRLQEDFQLPASYCEFAQKFGYGLLCNLFIIYIPMAEEDPLPERSAALKSVIYEGVEEELFEYDPDGSPELVQCLIPFGISENGEILAWNPDEPTAPNEYAIYLIGARLYTVIRCATDLYDFVAMCLDGNRGYAIFDDSFDLIEATFVPFMIDPIVSD